MDYEYENDLKYAMIAFYSISNEKLACDNLKV